MCKSRWSGVDKPSQCFDKRIGAEVRGVRTDNGNVARTPSTSRAPRKTLQTREEEKRVLQKQNEELNRYIQSEEKEKESLQSVITEQEKEIEKRKEQETLLRQEIADFVGYVSFFDFQKNALSLLQETVNQIQEQYERPETHQSNQTLNQLREENRKLMNKVEVRRKDERQLEIARKRMTNYGLSTNDIDVSGDEFVAIRRLEEMLQELKKVCEKSCH